MRKNHDDGNAVGICTVAWLSAEELADNIEGGDPSECVAGYYWWDGGRDLKATTFTAQGPYETRQAAVADAVEYDSM